MKYLTRLSDLSHLSPQLKRLVERPRWVSQLCLVPGKKQFGIWVFLEVQEVNFLGSLKVNINIIYFYMKFFHFAKRFLPLLTMEAFFERF